MTETPTPRRPRFSLRTLLTLTAWLAMGITIYLQWRELAPLRAENRLLHSMVGDLYVEDESMIYACQKDEVDSYEWHWQIYLPPGRNYRVRYLLRDIPEQGFPQPVNENSFPVERKTPGEGTYLYAALSFERSKAHGEWMGNFRIHNADRNQSTFSDIKYRGGLNVPFMGRGVNDWLEWPTEGHDRYDDEDAVARYSQFYDPTQPLILIRRRVAQFPTGQTFDKSQPTAGFMFWIEPTK